MTPDIEEKIKRDLIANPPQIFKENNANKPYHLPQTGYDIKLDEKFNAKLANYIIILRNFYLENIGVDFWIFNLIV